MLLRALRWQRKFRATWTLWGVQGMNHGCEMIQGWEITRLRSGKTPEAQLAWQMFFWNCLLIVFSSLDVDWSWLGWWREGIETSRGLWSIVMRELRKDPWELGGRPREKTQAHPLDLNPTYPITFYCAYINHYLKGVRRNVWFWYKLIGQYSPYIVYFKRRL